MSEANSPKVNPYPWTKRRRFMYIVTAFCMAVITYVLLRDMQSAVAETALTMAFITVISMAGSYVFGASWQDVNHMRIMGKGGFPGRGD